MSFKIRVRLSDHQITTESIDAYSAAVEDGALIFLNQRDVLIKAFAPWRWVDVTPERAEGETPDG